MPPGINLRRGNENQYLELYRGVVPYKWLFAGENLVFSDYRNDVPQVGSALFLEQVDYEVPITGRRIGGPIEYTGINANARAFKNLKCRLDWLWDISQQEVWTQTLTPGNVILPNPTSSTVRQNHVFAHPDPGSPATSTPWRITAVNPDGSANTAVGVYSVWSASDRRERIQIARTAAQRVRQVPGRPDSATATPYYEIRTDAIIRRIELRASDGQEGSFADQTEHLVEGLVTGTSSSVYNSGYVLTSGVSFTFRETGGVWNPSMTMTVYIEGEDDPVLTQPGLRPIRN